MNVKIHGFAHGETVWTRDGRRTGVVLHRATLTLTGPLAWVNWSEANAPDSELTAELARELRPVGVALPRPPRRHVSHPPTWPGLVDDRRRVY